MKVLVIGATGATGKSALPKLLAKGHEVTAFVRNPNALSVSHAALKVVQGDARNAEALATAVAGQDAVLVMFGPRSLKKDDLQETLDRSLVAAMKRHGVKRLVNL